MARKRHLFQEGTLSANLGGALTDTTMQSAELANLPVVLAPDTLAIVLDPQGAGGTPEVVLVTDHPSGSTSATITRQQEVGSGGSAVRSHAINTPWLHAITPLDHDHGNLDGLGDDDHPQYVNKTTAQPDISGDKGFLGRMGVGRVVSSVVHFIAQSPLDTRVSGGFQRASAAATADLVNFYSETGGVMASVDVAGRFRAPVGSVSEPGLSFHSDTDTGFYRSGADQVSLANGGVEKFRFGATGQIWAAGSIAHFGTNALGASGASVGIGDYGDPGTIYYRAFGTSPIVNHVVRPKGTNGRFSVQAEAGGTNVFDVDATAQWVQVNGDLKVGSQSVPRGIQHVATWNGPNNETYTTEATITNLSTSFAAVAGRRYRVSVMGLLINSSTAGRVIGMIRVDGVAIDRWVDWIADPNAIDKKTGWAIWEPGATQSYTVAASLSTSAGTVSINDGAKCQMVIEDVGAA